ncbi:hypothetical protein VOLCADRAFT_63158, partial [Volvox carteri f. nagariensis]
DGRSRQLGFIGFKSVDEAAAALRYYNRSYMDTAKLAVEFARKVGDEQLPRAWSKHTSGTTANRKLTTPAGAARPGAANGKAEDGGGEDPKLREFLALMQPRSKARIWANDEMPEERQTAAAADQPKLKRAPAAAADVSKLFDQGDGDAGEEEDQYQDWTDAVAGVRRGGGGGGVRSDDDEEKDAKMASGSEDDDDDDGGEDGDAHVRSRVGEKNGDGGSDDDGRGVRDVGGDVDMAAAASDAEADEEDLLETDRLFVRNLAYTATEADLSDLFGSFGDLQAVHLVVDRETKRSKGLAYVQYQIPEDAVRAAKQLDGGGGGGGISSFKAQREAQRKADAGNRSAWNTLFMRADTVADAVAAHYGLSKAALLDPSASGAGGESVAVRMALGEAQVIAATKQALAEAGVCVEALERAAAASGKAAATRSVARSGTALLVKNLPYSANDDELVELFGRHGPVSRLVLPPARALALVEFAEPQDARAAFKSLAYKKYHHVPLYLEWAPADVFVLPSAPPCPPDAKAATEIEEAVTAAADDDGDAAANPAVLGTIYVKNLAFSTGDTPLRKHFEAAVAAAGGSLHSALVARKKVPGTGKDGGGGTAVQSLGYGFVEVDSEAVAAAVIKKLQGSVLDGHKLVLQISRGRKSAAAGAGSTKLVVRNLAFEATKKDIQGLFNPFGHLKSCRLPKKFDGSHRGFAFVEFVTKQEAKNALEGLAGTHLYGRRLVVEYAREDDTLDDIRNKTAAKFKRDGELVAGDAPAKRLKL